MAAKDCRATRPNLGVEAPVPEIHPLTGAHPPLAEIRAQDGMPVRILGGERATLEAAMKQETGRVSVALCGVAALVQILWMVLCRHLDLIDLWAFWRGWLALL